MIGTVTSQRAVATECRGTDKFKPPIRRRADVIAVEVDQMLGVRHTVGIVTGRTGRSLVDNMESMTAILPKAVDGVKTLVAEQSIAIMTFVAKRVARQILGGTVIEDQLPFQNRGVKRAVRPIGAVPTSGGTLVAVMTIGAVNPARRCPGRQQARHIGIFTGTLDRMKRHIGSLKFEPRIGLDELAVHLGASAIDAIRMTPVA